MKSYPGHIRAHGRWLPFIWRLPATARAVW